MNHTPQIKKAIQFAARKHDGLYRKDSEPLPAITHLVSVAWFLAAVDASEEIIIGGLLHDTIEDTGTTGDEIERMFGAEVRILVEAVSEPARDSTGRALSWHERKEEYFKTLETANDNALIIATADKIDNIESKLDAYKTEGPALLERWPRPATEYIWYHGTALELAERRIPKHPLTARLREAHEREKKTFK